MSEIVRKECSADAPAIRIVNEAAFGRPDEANLVEALRAENVVLCSLVAELDGAVAGHVMFTRMWIETGAHAVPAVALAPVAVLPQYQRRGIGGRLIAAGLDHLSGRQERIVLVLGEPHYYSRFGFSAEKTRALTTPFPPEAYQAIELVPGALSTAAGKVRYPTAFGLPLGARD